MAKEAKAEETKVVIVDSKTPVAEVLALNTTPNCVLQFDANNFAELPDHVVKELKWENQRRYFMAWGEYKNKPRKSGLTVSELMSLDPLGGSAGRRLAVIEKGQKKGEHRVWKRPDELEECLDMGYRQLRSWKDSKKQADVGYSPEGDGEVLKLNSSDKEGKPFVELLGMVIDQERFERHLQAVSLKSVSRYQDVTTDLQEEAEHVNRGLKHRGGYVKVVSETEVGDEKTTPILGTN